jgi:hypothetical protein
MVNTTLYSDNHPETSTRGLGYKDQQTALDTIKKIKNRNLVYQFQVINTMYNRARFHPHQTIDMRKAMKVFKIWLDNYKKLNI